MLRATALLTAPLLVATLAAGQAPSPGAITTLRSIGGLPPEICNQFRDPLALQQAASGTYYVFDRRAHAVYSVSADRRSAAKVVDIGGEGGRLLSPSAFAAGSDGTFAVADAPRGQERLQVFNAAGAWKSGFFLPGRAEARVGIGGIALGGVSTLAYRDNVLAISRPESGSLVTEYQPGGTPIRSLGELRASGHEADRQLHLAMNSGIPVPHPDGGYVFVFHAGAPTFRRYDAKGELLFERVMQGRELDPIVRELPTRWPTRSIDGLEIPLVAPTVRTAAVAAEGSLWVSFVQPFTYVFNRDGEKTRTIQFRAAGSIAPTSLFFTKRGTILITPGCYEFADQ